MAQYIQVSVEYVYKVLDTSFFRKHRLQNLNQGLMHYVGDNPSLIDCYIWSNPIHIRYIFVCRFVDYISHELQQEQKTIWYNLDHNL